MKNSKELCHPLCLPFACEVINARSVFSPDDFFLHYYVELCFLREGKLNVCLDKERFLLSPGEAVLICPGVKHQIIPADDGPILLDLIRMDPDRMPEFPAYAPGLKSILTDARRARMPMVFSAEAGEDMHLSEMCAGCVRAAQRRRYGFDLEVTSGLTQICLNITQYWLSRGLTFSGRDTQEEPIYTLTGYIQKHLRDGLRVEDLAARCGLSYPWFAKKFREIYGVSCKDYIEQIRVAQVELYLRFTELDLARISEATGYADCSHMIKNFKRIRDITPGQYRLKERRAAGLFGAAAE